MTDFGARSQVADDVFLVVCICVFSRFYFYSTIRYAWSIRQVLEDARGREAVVVAVCDDHKGGTRVFSVFLNLVKRFCIRVCDFSKELSFFLVFFVRFLHADSRLTHVFTKCTTSIKILTHYKRQLGHMMSRSSTEETDVVQRRTTLGSGFKTARAMALTVNPGNEWSVHLTFTDFLLPCSSKALT